MNADYSISVLYHIRQRILGRPKPGAQVAAKWQEIEDIANGDYPRAVRRYLSQRDVKKIVGRARSRVWPNLNQQAVRLVSHFEFVRRWSAFGVDVKFVRLSSRSGLSLIGFYLPSIDKNTRPIIFVNAAHHPALVGLALDHEMGHHLTSDIFSPVKTHRLSLTAFREHLSDPGELAADCLAALGIFPLPVAKNLLGQSRAGTGNLSDDCLARAIDYVASRFGFRFELLHSVEKTFQGLAALIHYTKLRRTLLDEYRI